MGIRDSLTGDRGLLFGKELYRHAEQKPKDDCIRRLLIEHRPLEKRADGKRNDDHAAHQGEGEGLPVTVPDILQEAHGTQTHQGYHDDKSGDALCCQNIDVYKRQLLPYLVLDKTRGFETIPIAIQKAVKDSYGTVDTGVNMALLVLAILPVIVFYALCQKHIVKGVMAGAVKG